MAQGWAWGSFFKSEARLGKRMQKGVARRAASLLSRFDAELSVGTTGRPFARPVVLLPPGIVHRVFRF
ncbi:MAG: hypothetical protein CVU57_14445 [Deltaproteobacteria bacterium HGW-Deltaproteobacteria-15]|nr:MAG: hypothetical protein CVU57_14445 [Deltaproteobacteria bacterium HGW-Deltaproteobacteria-15]